MNTYGYVHEVLGVSLGLERLQVGLVDDVVPAWSYMTKKGRGRVDRERSLVSIVI
jgi:hypothetical protein